MNDGFKGSSRKTFKSKESEVVVGTLHFLLI